MTAQMTSTAIVRRTASMLMCSLVIVGLLSSAGRAGSDRCRPTPVKAPAEAQEAQRVADGVRVTSKATKRKPLILEYDHPASLGLWAAGLPTYGYLTFQVDGSREVELLNIETSWPTPSVSEFDIWLYDRWGEVVAESTAANPPVADEIGDVIWPGNTGGHGYEALVDFGARRCESFGLLIEGFWSAGEHITLKLWLAR